ncbi:MAG: signal peptide peptidase SppA, partial [Pseudomonadota bacterium]
RWDLAVAFAGAGAGAGANPDRADRIWAVGSGIGAYAALPVELPFLPAISYGLALERPTLPDDTLLATIDGPTMLAAALAFGGPSLAVGFVWKHYWEGGVLAGLDTFDAGLSLRMGSCLAIGAVIKDVSSPPVDGVPVERRYVAEMALRPTGDDRLEAALAARLGERRLDLGARFRLSLRLARGIYLRAEAAAIPIAELLEEIGTAGQPSRERHVFRGSVGLEVGLGRLAAAAHAIAGSAPGTNGDGGTSALGGSAVLRWSARPYPSLVPSRGILVRMKLEGEATERELAETLEQLGRVERMENVEGVVLVIGNFKGGMATVQELRGAIGRLRQRQKRVFAFLTSAANLDYYVAAAADRVYLDPAGWLRLVGVSMTTVFYKDLFDKVGVNAQFEKYDAYKSAPEAFTRRSPSEEASEMRNWILDGVATTLAEDLARDRHLSPAEVQRIIEQGPFTATQALEAGLIDALAEPLEVDKLLERELGRLYPVVAASALDDELPPTWSVPQIAIVNVEGDIVDGRSITVPFLDRRMVGGDTIALALAGATDDERVRAIVLRVNSGGGSALASEVIARAVAEAKKRKPVVVSLGDVAASGGYFAAANGDIILAEPSTITGSIGIFTGKFDLSFLLGRVGVTWDTGRRGEHADMESSLRPYTVEERSRIRENLRYYYDRFTGTVAHGRNLTAEQVETIAGGRVWTGRQALDHRLVDRLGGLGDAIAEAKRRAGLAEGEQVALPVLPTETASLLGRILGTRESRVQEYRQIHSRSVIELIPPDAAELLLRALPASLIVAPGTPQARIPFEIVIR